MNKELIDHVWKHCLPKEFKEGVKKEWQTANDEERFPHDAFLRGCYSTMVLLFGYHNLTSDAEEEEEMLYVSRKEVIRNFKEQVAWKNHHQSSQHDRDIAMGWCNALQFLFGSKCLPDENSSNVEKLEKNGEVEPKPAEPKFKVGDKVKDISSPHDGGIYKVDDIKKSSDGFIYHIQGLIGISNVKESALEPYTEPKNEDSQRLHAESVKESRIASEESHLRNSSQETANCDKKFDNILKDSFSKERRLNIAAMVMQGIMANSNPQMVEMDVHRVADLAILMADALIAECGKGDKK